MCWKISIVQICRNIFPELRRPLPSFSRGLEPFFCKDKVVLMNSDKKQLKTSYGNHQFADKFCNMLNVQVITMTSSLLHIVFGSHFMAIFIRSEKIFAAYSTETKLT